MVLDQSVPEYDAMRESIAKLRAVDRTSTLYDATLMDLTRDVLQ